MSPPAGQTYQTYVRPQPAAPAAAADSSPLAPGSGSSDAVGSATGRLSVAPSPAGQDLDNPLAWMLAVAPLPLVLTDGLLNSTGISSGAFGYDAA